MNYKTIIRNIQNIPGFRTDRKIIVIESDDWGSIGIPSKEVYDKLFRKSYNIENSPYLRFDSLASDYDMTLLADLLMTYHDNKGSNIKMTMNTIMTNPDFEKIRLSNYQKYYYENFKETIKHYPKHANTYKQIISGIKEGIFKPQFHGREHLCIEKWMTALQSGNKSVQTAFNNRMINLNTDDNLTKYGYMEEFDFLTNEWKLKRNDIINDGLNLFREVFGYNPKSFISCCYVWDDDIESSLFENGVKYIQGVYKQNIPILSKNKGYKHKYHYTGQKNKLGQKYLVRNCFFEPSLTKNDAVDKCLDEIKTAFKYKKPAIISSHRLNYVGYINEKNRDHNLRLFKELITNIIKYWEDVEFLFTDELGDLIDNFEKRTEKLN